MGRNINSQGQKTVYMEINQMTERGNSQLGQVEIASFPYPQTSNHLMTWSLDIYLLFVTNCMIFMTQMRPKIEKPSGKK
jgi:hypothetical protein